MLGSGLVKWEDSGSADIRLSISVVHPVYIVQCEIVVLLQVPSVGSWRATLFGHLVNFSIR